MGKWIGVGALILGILLLVIIAPIALAAALMGGGQNECAEDAGGQAADGPVYLVGDSIGVGIKDKLPARFTVNAEENRQLPAGIDIVRGAPQALKDASAVVVELGTNKSNGFAGDAQDMVQAIKDKNSSADIYWVEIFSGGDYSAENNAIKNLEDVSVILTKGKGIQMADNIHPNPAGYERLANIVSGVVGNQGGAAPDDGGEAGGGIDEQAAVAYAQGRDGQVSFAVANSGGSIVATHRGSAKMNGLSITKAMILVARMRDLGGSPIPDAEKSQLEAMIRQSDNDAANHIFDKVGSGKVQAVAEEAGMENFQMNSSGDIYRLGLSQVSANDQARFFAKLKQLIPEQNRSYALNLMKTLELGNWGLTEAGLPGEVYSKAGWAPQSDSPGKWRVLQGAHFGEGFGVAVLTEGNPGESYAQETIKGVAEKLGLQNVGNNADC